MRFSGTIRISETSPDGLQLLALDARLERHQIFGVQSIAAHEHLARIEAGGDARRAALFRVKENRVGRVEQQPAHPIAQPGTPISCQVGTIPKAVEDETVARHARREP
jgi:hypothetical protein